MELLRSGFHGSEILLRQGFKTLGSLRKTSSQTILNDAGGLSYSLRREKGEFLLFDSIGLQIASYSPGAKLHYQRQIYEILPDSLYPDWFLLKGAGGILSRFAQDHVDLLADTVDPVLLLFVAWIIQEGRSQLVGNFWVSG